MFSIITNYYKSKNITRKETSNLRFLFPYFSKLLIIYLVYIIPFKDYINKNYFNLNEYSSPYLLTKNNKVLTSVIITRILKQESSLFFREPLIISSYRKIINYIIKLKLKENIDYYNSSSNSNSSNLIEDKQSNRSTKTSFNYYLNISNIFNNNNNIKEINKIEEFSIKYWNYFNLITSKDLNNSLIEDQDYITIILNNYNTKSLENNIKRLFKNSNSSFKNIEQKSAIVSLIQNTTYLTYINKTSSGKSLLYLLLSFIYTNNIYIIITPRVNLTKDLFNKAKNLNLNPSLLNQNNINNSNLIFINISDLNTKELDNLLSVYNRLNKNITIFLNEIHLFLLEKDFRLHLKHLTTIIKYLTNLVFISATLPNSLIKLLEKEFSITNNNNIIKGNCNRNNISYKRIYYKEYSIETIISIIVNIINIIELTDNNINNKIVIFVNNIKQGKQLEKLLNYKFIYSNIENKFELEELFNNLDLRVIITTSILEVGLDLQNITYTINLEPIFSLISIIQSSGRIRNSGISYIISKEPNNYLKTNFNINSILNKEINTISDFKDLDKSYYTLFTIETNCLRIPINLLLNNTNYYKCSNNDNYCSICLEKQTLLNNTFNIENNKYKENNYYLINLENKLLDYYNNYCFYCLINLKTNYKHSFNNCTFLKINIELNNIYNNIQLEYNNNNNKLLKSNLACNNK